MRGPSFKSLDQISGESICTRARTCIAVSMTKVTSSNQEPRVCRGPVHIDMEQEEADEKWKIDSGVSVVFSKCGERQIAFRNYSGWGEGCARECTQLLCEVYDWTDHRCKSCENLFNSSLCSQPIEGEMTGHLQRDKSMSGTDLTLDVRHMSACQAGFLIRSAIVHNPSVRTLRIRTTRTQTIIRR